MPERRRSNVHTSRYWATALAFIINRICMAGFLIGLMWVVYKEDANELWWPGGFAIGVLMTSFLLLVNVSEVICPLCRTPVFKGMGGVQRKPGRKRFGFALRLLFRQRNPQCPYCKEPFRWLR